MSSKKVDMFIRMLGDPDHRMRAIQKIEALGAAAHEAVPELWNVVMDQNGEPQVRAAALKAIVTISGENPQTAEGLIDRLAHDPASEVVLQAAQSLEDYGTILKRKLPKLWEILERERNINYRFAIARAIIRIDGNKKKMLEQVMQALKQPGEHLWAMMAILSELELSDAETNQALEVLWDVMRQNQPLEVVDPTFLAIVDLTADDDAVLEKLLNDDKIDAQTRVFAIIEPKLWNNVTDAFIKASNDRLLLSAMLEALKLEDKDVNRDSRRSYWDKLDLIRRDVIGLLKGVKKNVFDNDVLSEVRAAVETCLEETGVGLGFIYNYDADDARQWLRDHRKPFPGVGEFLLREADDNFRDEQWENDTEATLGHIIQVITKSNEADWQLLSKGVDQLKAKRTEISLKLCKMVKPDLEAAEKAASEGSNRKYYAAQALDVIKQRQDKLEKEDLLDDIQQEDKKDEGERIKKIRQLVDSESPESLRGLVDIWIKWMVNNEHSAAVETIAVLMRESPMAVAPLVDQLVKNLPIDAQIRARVLNEIGAQESQVHRALEKLLNLETQEDEITPVDEHYISEWLEGFESKPGEFGDIFQAAKERNWSVRKQAKEIVGWLEKQTQKEREQLRYRRIAQQLANMSDPRFFKDADLHELIRMELVKHAVPTLARQLPTETDVVAREHLARALANLGGREAVDALVRAVVDEEKKRAARQDLLAKYYLEPSKQQSDDAAKLLSGAVADAKNTLKILQNLNITVVVVGLVLLLVGVLTSLISKDLSTRLVGALAGIGGLAGVIIQLINNPLDRIQNAMANLVQIETAFTSFIWELNLNGTYIQSQYVAEGILTNDEIGQTVSRIENAMSLAMNLVAVYTEEGRQRVVTRINSVSPAAGQLGSQLVIHGHHLQGDGVQKKEKERTGTIAINHKPIDAKNLSWAENEVKFTLPPKIPGLEGNSGIVWVSLLIDGLETNALPFHVTTE